MSLLAHYAPATGPLAPVVAAAAAHDQDAWAALHDTFSRTLQGVGRSYRLNPQDAEDVAQTTWLRLVESIGKLRTPEALGGWLCITARREALRLLQGASREILTDDAALMEAETTTLPEARLVAEERRRAVRHALATLPDRQRHLLELLMSESAPSYDAISAATGMPVGSIGPTRQRSLEKLRRDARVRRAAAGC
jgi:RNA polymerase sigma factor (sigma-70 family)